VKNVGDVLPSSVDRVLSFVAGGPVSQEGGGLGRGPKVPMAPKLR